MRIEQSPWKHLVLVLGQTGANQKDIKRYFVIFGDPEDTAAGFLGSALERTRCRCP